MDEQDRKDAAAVALCTSCGLCCSGALYDTAPLEPDEVAAAEAKGFAPYEDPPGQARFAFPCRHLQGTRCGIYPDRPRVCGSFRCELLKNFDAGRISMDEAQATVVQAKEHIAATRTIAAAEAGVFTPRQWGELLQSWSVQSQAGRSPADKGRLVLELARLNRFLDIHFRASSQQVVREKK